MTTKVQGVEAAPLTGLDLGGWIKRHLSKPTLWILLIWAGVNTGPWHWQDWPVGTRAWIHALRTGFPLLVLAAGLPMLLKRHAALSGPLKCWILYGFVGLVASLYSLHPYHALYWACNYLAVFAGVGLYLKNAELERAQDLNHLSWAITLGILAIMVFVARDALFVRGETGLTAYGVVQRVGDVGGILISRASGFARFAAVPAVAGFAMMWGRGIQNKMAGAAVFLPSALLVWFLQSRGAIFGLAFALFFVTFFLGKKTRWLAFVGGVLCAFMLWTDSGAKTWADYVYRHISRGQAIEEMMSMTGRDRAWRHAWPEINDHPFIGQGFQADRFTINEHVHNTYMYALMTAGYIGAGLFCLGLAWAWYLFWKAWKMDWGHEAGQHLHLVQAGGVLAFFTVRSIPEVSGAMYSIDLFLMASAIAYLTMLKKMVLEGK